MIRTLTTILTLLSLAGAHAQTSTIRWQLRDAAASPGAVPLATHSTQQSCDTAARARNETRAYRCDREVHVKAAITPTPPPTTPPADAPAGPRVSAFTPSGPITASTGQVIAGVSIANASGACITVPAGVTGVVIRDSKIGPCGGSGYMAGNVIVRGQATIEHNLITQGVRGVAAERTSGLVLRRNVFDTFRGPHPMGKAVELNYMSGARVEGNLFRGRDYASDVLSAFESRNMQYVGNDFDVHISEPSSAAFTMGDGTGGDPGGNNYVARNIVRQQGTGVPAGVFGSSGNTVLELNCFASGLQAYNYAGTFVGVTIRRNVINLGASYVPDTSVIAEWGTNVDGTDCSKVPQ